MSSRPTKRARSNADTDIVDPSKVPELVGSIDPKTISQLLIAAAKAYPDIASLVQQEVDRIAAAERAKSLDFDYLSKSVWKTLNVTYEKLKSSHAYEMAGQAANDIEDCIKELQTKCPKIASFRTKENALETLRKIGKSICLSNGVVGHEVRKDRWCGSILVSTILGIAEGLTHEEIGRLRPWCDDKLVELQGIADGYCIFEDLAEVIDLWGEDQESESESEHEGSSDSNEDAERPSGDEEEVESERLVAGTGTAPVQYVP